MTRMHFVAIAKTIRNMDVDDTVRLVFAHEMANTLANFNDLFDRGRFVTAATK